MDSKRPARRSLGWFGKTDQHGAAVPRERD
jgi:hypothetical protein